MVASTYLKTSGTTKGTMPSAARCSAARSASQSRRKSLDIEEVGGGGCEDRDVTGPAEPLVSLGAIGRYVEEVAAGTPNHVAVKLVKQLVGALELPDPPQFRGNNNGSEGVRR